MSEPAGPESRPAEPVRPASGRRPGAVVALVVIAVIVSGLVSAGVTLGVLRYESRTDPLTINLGSNVRLPEESAVITVANRAAAAVVAVVTDDTSDGPAIGSGFMITSDGFIVTNTLVLAGARSVTVLVAGDNRRHDARIVDADCQTGLAILKVDGVSQQPTLAFADVTNLAIGQTVIAVGTPLDPRYAVTKGIVSALHHDLKVVDPVRPNAVIQFWDTTGTDVLIGPGNSGGPLLNVAGQVTGILVAATSAANERATFALSAADIQAEAEQIVRDGTLVIPSLGAITEDVSPESIALRSGTTGAAVRALRRGGAAETAGVRVGDVIAALDEVRLTSAHPLGQLLRSTRFHPDQRVSVSLVRGGETIQVQVTLGREHPACT